MTKLLKQHLPDVIMVLLFAVISFAYFFPADTEGRILYRHDTAAGRGLGIEQQQYFERTGERTRWTNSAFSGMPTYQSAPSYDSTQTLSAITKAYHLWLPENVWFVFAYLLGFFIMLRAFDFKWYLAALGSVIWAFSSYFLIIIAAGHLWKVMALAYLPPMIGGIVLTYRGRYLWGFIVTALFAAMEILANHVQMTYYYMIIILCMVVAYLIEAIRNKQIGQFVKATGVCIAAAVIAVLMNASNLYHTWEYQNESMRGKSELVKTSNGQQTPDPNQTSSGLDRDYITQWSYGIDETWTLLIPNTKGGSSMSTMADSKTAMDHADNNYVPVYQQIGQYWGEQPGTSGPVYVGAFVMMLFILGLIIVKGPMKWALLVATIISVLLSWGHNFMPFTDLFLDYVPMYAKFRTVASILVVAEFTIPLLAIMALKRVIDIIGRGEEAARKSLMRNSLISFVLTAGICVLFAIMPTLFFTDFVSQAEMNALSQFPPEQLNPLLSNLREMRQAVFTADCWRSFWIITVCSVALVLFMYRKLRAEWMVGIITIVCLFDMWQVDKRYLNDDMFVNADERDIPQQMTNTDRIILQDKSLDYRVLNLASNTFNENETSYYHKSIGGYHAAKLRRYQELIEKYIHPEMQTAMTAIVEAQGDMAAISPKVTPVLDMLNAKYFILPLQGGETTPVKNPYTYGNAWYVDNVTYAENANQELDGMAKIDLRHQAIADKKFKDTLGASQKQDSTATVKLLKYEPNHLEYTAESKQGGVIAFSEIYYPGWTATIDGQPAELGRVNYVLRALNVKAGKHQIVLDFHPQTVQTTETLAYVALAILVVMFLIICFLSYRARKNTNKQE